MDDRLDRRARLAHRLGGAVERLDARIEAALHRQHAAGCRLLDDETAGNLGDRAQREGAAFGRDREDVADLQRGEGSAALAAYRHLRSIARQAAGLAVAEAERGRTAADRGDDRRAPIHVIQPEIGVEQRGLPGVVANLDMAQRAAPAPAAVEAEQAVAQRRLARRAGSWCRARCAPTGRPNRRCTGLAFSSSPNLSISWRRTSSTK